MPCNCDKPPVLGPDGEPVLEPAMQPVPQGRILEKLHEILDKGDMAAAERHLCYWLEEALLAGDLRGQLTLRNELTGHYRKAGDRERALENAEAALHLLGKLGLEGTLTAAVTRINAATALCAFGENERALQLFQKAREILEEGNGATCDMLGGLYNNMGLASAALGRFEEALSLYDSALQQMEKAPHGELERAITCLNQADALSAMLGAEAAEDRTNALVEEALRLLATPALPRDGYYAFVAEKCAPSVEYYGYFLDAERLRGEAKRIYEGT